jgi:hypothetical protein
LCYAPQYGAAKDPVNLAGMLAENVLNGDMPLADWRQLGTNNALLLDTREPPEFDAGHIPGRRCARGSPSYRRTARSGSAAASGSERTTQRDSWRNTDTAKQPARRLYNV